MTVAIEVEGLKPLQDALTRFGKFRNDFRTKLPRRVLREQKKRIQERLRTKKQGPDGETWDQLTDETRAARQRKGTAGLGTLVDSRALVNSFRVVFFAGKGELGTALPYAKAQHFSHPAWQRKSPRPYFGLGRADITALDRLICEWVEEQWP